jgi:hypothetical protein
MPGILPTFERRFTRCVLPNVEMIRANDGAARATHETCLRKASDPMIG